MNAQEHLLTELIEECSEIAKNGCKSLRFGLDDRNVLHPDGPTNRERVIYELNDLMAVVEMLEEADILPHGWQDDRLVEAKRAKVTKFMDYAVTTGALLSPTARLAPTSDPMI